MCRETNALEKGVWGVFSVLSHEELLSDKIETGQRKSISRQQGPRGGSGAEEGSRQLCGAVLPRFCRVGFAQTGPKVGPVSSREQDARGHPP